MKMTVSFTEAELKSLILEAVKQRFPGKNVGNVKINVSAGYESQFSYSPPSVSSVSVDVET
jgi:hypothetical protein